MWWTSEGCPWNGWNRGNRLTPTQPLPRLKLGSAWNWRPVMHYSASRPRPSLDAAIVTTFSLPCSTVRAGSPLFTSPGLATRRKPRRGPDRSSFHTSDLGSRTECKSIMPIGLRNPTSYHFALACGSVFSPGGATDVSLGWSAAQPQEPRRKMNRSPGGATEISTPQVSVAPPGLEVCCTTYPGLRSQTRSTPGYHRPPLRG